MEAYKVWVTLNLKGDAQQKMQKFVAETTKANVQVAKLTKTLPMAVASFMKMAESLKLVNPEFAKFSTTMIRFNSNVSGAKSSVTGFNTTISASANRMSTASNRADKLAGSLNAVATASSAIHKVNAGINGGIRNTGAGRGRGGGSLSHGIAAALGASHFGGMGAAAVGFGGAALLKSSFHHAMEYQNEEALLLGQNIPGMDSAAIKNFVDKTKIRGASKFDVLQMLADAAVITKGKEEAEGVAPTLTLMKTVLGGLLEGGFSKTQMQAAIKTAEIVSGSKEPDILNKHLGMMSKATLATSGRVNPETYQSVVRSARGYTAGLDPDFFYYQLEPVIQEYGKRVGPMIAGFYRHFLVGRISTDAAKLAVQGGLADKSKFTYDSTGRLLRTEKGAIHGMGEGEIGRKNIFQWFDKYFNPFLDKLGAKTSAQRTAIAGKMMPDSDLALFQIWEQQRPKIIQAAQVNRNTQGLESQSERIGKMHAGKIQDLSASFVNFANALDKLTGPGIEKTLEMLTKFFNGFAYVVDKITTKSPEEERYKKEGLLGILRGGSSSSSLLNDAQLASMQSSSDNDKTINMILNGDVFGKAVIKYTPGALNNNISYGVSSVNPNSPIANNFFIPGLI